MFIVTSTTSQNRYTFYYIKVIKEHTYFQCDENIQIKDLKKGS